jgi:arylsulfatase A-like enzyme
VIKKRNFCSLFCLTIVLLFEASSSQAKPNLIFIMADDLGYGDLGCYGQKLIKTPRLDQMAKEGMKFTRFYSGSTVCAPSRSVLMTGQHMGHTHVRGNAGGDMSRQSLRDIDLTVAEKLKETGYKTALIGKWGLGEVGQEGHPLKQGFDYFYGYLNQVHAHNFYPEFLWRNQKKHALKNVVKPVSDKPRAGFMGGAATKRVEYSHDLFTAEALTWIKANKENPFFLYLPLTIPHANNEGTRMFGDGAEVPDYGIYEKENWTKQDKGQAAMITRMDRDVGRLLDLLKELKIEENTLVMFTSDNGPHNEAGHNPELFKPAGPLRGMKRTLTEGGIRVPTLAWWPNTIEPNSISDQPFYFGDLMATACDMTQSDMPLQTDSLSFLPILKGKAEEQKRHKYLYWEFYERTFRQAVIMEDWKLIRSGMDNQRLELYDLKNDIHEDVNLIKEQPAVAQRMLSYMESAHVPHPNWTTPKRK